MSSGRSWGSGDASDGAVISVPPRLLEPAMELMDSGLDAVTEGLGALISSTRGPALRGVFRYLRALPDLEPIGEWV